MSADEIIHLISNQALNKDVKESHKLIIQDCCKELFKKKETIKKYKKITYLHSKIVFEDHEAICSTKVKKRIVEITDDETTNGFPETIHYRVLDRRGEAENKYVTLYNSCDHNQNFTILEMEDI